jgi:hypothetical protein
MKLTAVKNFCASKLNTVSQNGRVSLNYIKELINVILSLNLKLIEKELSLRLKQFTLDYFGCFLFQLNSSL